MENSFDDRGLALEGVVDRFQLLLNASHLAYFPPDRLGREYDYLRHDLSVMVFGGEVVLTNVSGFFMMGLPADSARDPESPGAHGNRLAFGIGQATSAFTTETLEDVMEHGNHDLPAVDWRDATASDALPSTYGGQLAAPNALALMTIHSAVQAARMWAHTHCCEGCASAARKHRFVTLYQALRSIEVLSETGVEIGDIGREAIATLLGPETGARTILSGPFRRLRNGWVHLGVGDVAAQLPADPWPSDLVSAYTKIEPAELDVIVDTGLQGFAAISNAWMLEPGVDGSTLLEHLVDP